MVSDCTYAICSASVIWLKFSFFMGFLLLPFGILIIAHCKHVSTHLFDEFLLEVLLLGYPHEHGEVSGGCGPAHLAGVGPITKKPLGAFLLGVWVFVRLAYATRFRPPMAVLTPIVPHSASPVVRL